MECGEQDSEDDEDRVNLVNPLDGRLPIEAFENVGKEFEEEDRGVDHDAHTHLEHDGVGVAVDELMPDVPGAAQVEHQSDDEEQIAQKRGQHGGTDDTVQTLDVKQVDGADHAETAGGEHDSAEAVEADPEAPGELVGHVGNGAQAAEITNEGGVDAQGHDHEEYDFPKGQLDLHLLLPFCFFASASASATSSRR